jgi:hypothetical protein
MSPKVRCYPLLDLDIKSQSLEFDLDIFVSLDAQLPSANMRLAQQDGNRVQVLVEEAAMDVFDPPDLSLVQEGGMILQPTPGWVCRLKDSRREILLRANRSTGLQKTSCACSGSQLIMKWRRRLPHLCKTLSNRISAR